MLETKRITKEYLIKQIDINVKKQKDLEAQIEILFGREFRIEVSNELQDINKRVEYLTGRLGRLVYEETKKEKGDTLCQTN